MVVSVGLGPSSLSWLPSGSTNGWEVESPSSVPWGTIVEVREYTIGCIPQIEFHKEGLSSLQQGLPIGS